MKRTVFVYSLLVYLSIGTMAAQRPGLDSRCVIRDTNYDGYMILNNSLNHDTSGNFYSHYVEYGYWYEIEPSKIPKSVFYGSRYYTDTPIQVYGVACVAWGTPSIDPVYYRDWQGCLPIDGIDSLWGMLLQKEGGSHYIGRDSARWHNQLRPGNLFYQGVRLWKPVLYFDIPWSPHRHNLGILPLSEFYFDAPLTVNDTFWVGIKNWDKTDSNCIWMYPRTIITNIGGPVFKCDSTSPRYRYDHHFYDDLLLLNDNMEKDTIYMKRTHLLDFRYSFFPIIKPYEEDSVFCDTVPGFHLAGTRVGYPTFAWDTDWYREEELFEVQFAPYHPGAATPDEAWRTVTTTDSSIEVYSVFDPDIYYQARIRARRHHLCPIHDTVMWGPWCDPILFYTGPTAPDTTTAISPVEGNAADFFTLSPNPTTGMVRVTVGHTPQSGTHSSVSRADGSPNLGEQLVLTLTDAAGREVLRKALPAGTGNVELDISGLAAGTYFVTLSTPASSATQRLVLK